MLQAGRGGKGPAGKERRGRFLQRAVGSVVEGARTRDVEGNII